MHDPRLMHDPRFGHPPHDPFRGAADVLQFPSFFRERLNVNASALRRVVGAGSLAKLFHENIGLWRHECAVVEHARARVDAGLAADGRAGGDRPLLLSLAQDARRPASERERAAAHLRPPSQARDPPFVVEDGHARALRYLFIWPRTEQSVFIFILRRGP